MVNAKILVVEDESIVAQDIQASLKSMGYTVPAVVASGEEAIKKAAQTHPDLVLMDIHLQGAMDGVEAARQISTHLNIPVIYLTANADDSTFERAKVTEPFGYILKPFEERELSTTIEIALYKHRMESKLKQHQQWLNTILSNIGDAVIATNAQGVVTFMNPVAEALTGWQQVEARSKNLSEVFPIVKEETQISVNSPALEAMQQTGGASKRSDTILLTKDGKPIAVESSTGLLKDDQGNSHGTVLVFRDITEQKRAEALKAFAVKLEQNNHELQELLYVTSHILPP
ncbi:MAG TPA: response regulator, partial [Candidatus Caenarcaniphilales bacterium]